MKCGTMRSSLSSFRGHEPKIAAFVRGICKKMRAASPFLFQPLFFRVMGDGARLVRLALVVDELTHALEVYVKTGALTFRDTLSIMEYRACGGMTVKITTPQMYAQVVRAKRDARYVLCAPEHRFRQRDLRQAHLVYEFFDDGVTIPTTEGHTNRRILYVLRALRGALRGASDASDAIVNIISHAPYHEDSSFLESARAAKAEMRHMLETQTLSDDTVQAGDDDSTDGEHVLSDEEVAGSDDSSEAEMVD